MDPLLKASPRPAAPAVTDGTTESFVADVLEASRDALVVVDFWAPWCGPCKQLSPVIERVIEATQGAARLVKINIDDNPEIAREMHIQSIPAVYAFYQGRPVDGFMGALPESQVKAFIDRLVKATHGEAPAAALGEIVAEADKMLAEGDAPGAEHLYKQILEADPANKAALAGAIRCRIAGGDVAAARKLFDRVPGELKETAEIAAARTALEMAEARPGAGALRAAQEKIAADPGDHQARFDLAAALFAESKPDEAVDHLVEIVKRDRAWNDEAARRQLLKLFEALGPAHPATLVGRRKLSSVLFS